MSLCTKLGTSTPQQWRAVPIAAPSTCAPGLVYTNVPTCVLRKFVQITNIFKQNVSYFIPAGSFVAHACGFYTSLRWDVHQDVAGVQHRHRKQDKTKGYFTVYSYIPKGPVTQAPITRTKTRTIQMHALDWLKCSTQNTPTLVQPIEGVHLYRYRFRYSFRSRYRGLCDRALSGLIFPGEKNVCVPTVSKSKAPYFPLGDRISGGQNSLEHRFKTFPSTMDFT